MFLPLDHTLCLRQRKHAINQSTNYIQDIRKRKTQKSQDSPAKAEKRVPVFRHARRWPTNTKKINKSLNLVIGHHQALFSVFFAHTLTRVPRPDAHHYDLLEVALELLRAFAFLDLQSSAWEFFSCQSA